MAWYKRFPPEGGSCMDENEDKWKELCAQAATEQDPDKLLELIAQINQLLEARERRLQGSPPVTETPS